MSRARATISGPWWRRVSSVVARAEFLKRLDGLSRRFGVPLPKGAGPLVLAAGRLLVERHGAEVLARVAKLHLRTTRQLAAGPA